MKKALSCGGGSGGRIPSGSGGCANRRRLGRDWRQFERDRCWWLAWRDRPARSLWRASLWKPFDIEASFHFDHLLLEIAHRGRRDVPRDDGLIGLNRPFITTSPSWRADVNGLPKLASPTFCATPPGLTI